MKLPEPYSGNEPYLFISYSHKDIDAVIPVIDFLQGKGFRIWCDEGIDPGAEYAITISKRLTGCSIFVSFLSNNYFNSKYCKGELNFAHTKGKQILNIYLRNEPMPDELALWFDLYQNIHQYRYPDLEAFYPKFMETRDIKQCMKQPAAPVPPDKQTAAEEWYQRGLRFYEVKEYQNAAACNRKAAELGYAPAQFSLGRCYDFGNGVAKDCTEAVKWFRKAAEQGNETAKRALEDLI